MTKPSLHRVISTAIGLLSVAACSGESEPAPGATSAVMAQTGPASSLSKTMAAQTGPSLSSSAVASTSSSKDGGTNDAGPALCPGDMVLAQGRYCPRVEEPECLQFMKDYEQEAKQIKRAETRGEKPPKQQAIRRCLRYAAPGKCLSEERRPMKFCIDRYEWPNKVGELPSLLVTWAEARKACQGAGKRLCTADEFNFACEGEDLLPYSYGLNRDSERCSVDKPYVILKRRLAPYEHCMKIAACRDQLEKVDQRVPIGSTPRCTSPFGALDLNGNVNEWVELPGKSYPWRSGLKGGWWGPARSRCRPMVTSHDENYAGYEVGFRCCRDAADG